jgi:F420H(2)-dependent quinone reductase
MMLIVYRTLDQGKSMATRYRLSLWRRLLNHLVRALLRVELGPRRTYLLTVQGCQTGRPYSTPVTLVEEEGQRWLVAPYGVVGWVRKARPGGQCSAGAVALRRAPWSSSGQPTAHQC